MKAFLNHDIVFGPVKSRRLGNSLGINLLPKEYKLCNFNCIYCECGWTYKNEIKHIKNKFRSVEEVSKALARRLEELKKQKLPVDSITFAGCGEPTIHPDFHKIIDMTIILRNQHYPEAQISVLSNATMLHNPKVFRALLKVDRNIQKLDSAITETFLTINKPLKKLTPGTVIENLKKFHGKVMIQTLFLRGHYQSTYIDNTTNRELDAWLHALEQIKPQQVMVYTIARRTPAENLKKIPPAELYSIAEQVKKLGIDVIVAP